MTSGPPAWCLGDSVCSGVIENTETHRVTGRLDVRGRREPIALDLTGNCESDLRGRRIEFEPSAEADPVPDAIDLSLLDARQIGATGVISRRHRMAHARERSDLRKLSLVRSAPEEGNALVLEWFGPAGQVVVEIFEPRVVDSTPPSATRRQTKPPRANTAKGPAMPATYFVAQYLRSVYLEMLGLGSDAEEIPEAVAGLDLEDVDPWGLFSQSPHVTRDDRGALVSTPVFPLPSARQLARDAPRKTPFEALFVPPLLVPPADPIDDAMLDAALKSLIARFAQHAVEFRMCEHATPRIAYELLVDEILATVDLPPEDPEHGPTLLFSTADWCAACKRRKR